MSFDPGIFSAMLMQRAQGNPMLAARMAQLQPLAQQGMGGGFHGNYNTPQSPGMGFLLGHLASRNWSPQPMAIQGYGGLMGSGGFNSFMGSMTSRFGAPSAAYQGYLQSLQERRDARAGVPAVPPQGPTSASAQRRIPAQSGRSY